MKNRKWYIISLGVLFLILTVLVKTSNMTSFDTAIYNFLTRNMNSTLTTMYKCFTFLGSTLFIIILVLLFLGCFIFFKKRNKGFVVAATLIISTVINNVIKLIIRRDRPSVLRLVEEHTFSYPSGHAMAAFSMYGILIYLVIKSNLSKKMKLIFSIILGIIPVLVGMSRIYLGAHYASDIIGGFLVSGIILLTITYYIDKNKWI